LAVDLGRLPVTELARGTIALDVTGSCFEVMDNAYADPRADLLVRVMGNVTRPEIVGSIE
jgi:hypothetical protein